MQLLTYYKDTDQNMASLLEDMKQLDEAFQKVNITYTYKESTVEIVDGVMVIKDNSTSTIEISNEDLAAIKAATSAIRNKIIS
jgi:predicted DNA binding CopG/RHH family protein